MLSLALCCPLFQSDDHEQSFRFAPDGPLYAAYVADPRRPVFGLSHLTVVDASVPSAGDDRFNVRMGTRFGIARFGGGELGVDAEVGFVGQFDLDESQDGIGWDGIYGLDLVWAPRDTFAARFGYGHDSAHVTDEYAEETGRERIGYTREELRLGVRLTPDDRNGAYAEVGWDTHIRERDPNEPFRVQFGLEHAVLGREARDVLGPFAALDLSFFEEDDWEPNASVLLGWERRASSGGVWRFGVEAVSGRSPLGEFFRERETFVGVGVWFDP